MDKKQIIQMARDAGWEATAEIWYPFLERFAAAIRAATKEEDAKICEDMAFIAYEFLSDECDSPQEVSDLQCHECATQIRASK